MRQVSAENERSLAEMPIGCLPLFWCGFTPRLTLRLNKKMKAGLAKHLAGEFKGYGQPTAFVFKGRHIDAGKTFDDYVIRFGPGSLLKFGVALDRAGKIASISLG